MAATRGGLTARFFEEFGQLSAGMASGWEMQRFPTPSVRAITAFLRTLVYVGTLMPSTYPLPWRDLRKLPRMAIVKQCLMMKASSRFSMLMIAVCLAAVQSPVHAERLASPTVGFLKQSTAAKADSLCGLPLHRTPTWAGAVSEVSINTLSIEATLEANVLVSTSHYLHVTSGALQGHCFPVSSHTTDTVTVSPNGGADLATQGVLTGDQIQIIAHWTLGTLFPGGEGVVASSNVFSPQSTVWLYDLSRIGTGLVPSYSYLYHDGTQGPAGWYSASDPGDGLKNDVVVSQETFFVIRHVTDEIPELVISGQVPSSEIGTSVGRFADDTAQDNLIVNPYPLSFTLGSSNLVESGAMEKSSNVFSPTDTLWVFGAPTGYGTVPVKAYMYHDGAQGPEGWYDVSDPGAGLINGVSISGGAPMILRKRTGNAGTVMWIPALPYNS